MVPVSLPTLALFSIPGFTPISSTDLENVQLFAIEAKVSENWSKSAKATVIILWHQDAVLHTQVGSLSIFSSFHHMDVPGLFWEVWHICVNIPKISQCLHLFWDKLNIHITGMLHRVSDKLTHRINYRRTAIETNPVGKWNKCNLQLVPEDIGVGIVGDICIGTRGQGLLAMIICVTNCNFTIIPCSSSSASTLYPHKTN